VPVRDPELLARAGRQLGQDLLDPPNVKGWPGGQAWITASTLLARQQFLQRVLRGQDTPLSANGQMTRATGEGRPLSYSLRSPSAHAVAGNTTTPGPVLAVTEGKVSGLTPDRLTRLLLPIAPVQPLPKETERRTLIEHLVLDPVYQLQ